MNGSVNIDIHHALSNSLSHTRISLTTSDRSLVLHLHILLFHFCSLGLHFLFASPSKLSSSILIPPTSPFSSHSSLSLPPDHFLAASLHCLPSLRLVLAEFLVLPKLYKSDKATCWLS